MAKANKTVTGQVAKFVNHGKTGGNRLLGVEAVFTTAGAKVPTELSNLCRLVLKANDTTGEKPKNLTANIPMTDFPAILEAAKRAYKDSLADKKSNFEILKGQAKPKVSDETEEGTLVYKAEIKYDASRTYPVTITVTNFRATVTKAADGTLKYSSPSKEQPYISVFCTAAEFLNKMTHIESLYNSWMTAAAINGDFDRVPTESE